MTKQQKTYLLPFILITSLFFFWGFIQNLNPVLIPHLRKAFQLTDVQSSLVDSSIFIAYFLMAIPAGRFMQRFGYKKGILFGLTLFAIGSFLFIPAADTKMYAFFLGALFILSCGLAFLETAANPYVTVLGPEDTASRRLNFAQSFNGLAVFLAPIIGGKFILREHGLSYDEVKALNPAALQEYITQEANSVKGPYLVVGSLIIIVAIAFIFIKLPEIKEKAEAQSNILKAWRHKHLRWAVIAQFFYLGAQTCTISFFIRFVVESAGITAKEAAWYSGAAGLAFMIGRFVGTYLMKFIKPHRLLMLHAIGGMLFTAIAIFGGGNISIYSLIVVTFFLSIMFPTIFSLGIAGLGSDTKSGSSLIVMSIVGGAIFPIFLGLISDLTGNIQFGYFVPLVCLFVVFLFSRIGWQPSLDKPTQIAD